MPKSVTLIPYQISWEEAFLAEEDEPKRVLAPWLLAGIEHIGSTSIPGLAAKPVIDMVAGVKDLDAAAATVAPLTSLGYAHAIHRPQTLWFYRDVGLVRTNDLHLTQTDSDLLRERVAFRDALRADNQLAREYEALKVRDAADAETYTMNKRSFVNQVVTMVKGIPLRPVGARL